jgi:hypothetical protein
MDGGILAIGGGAERMGNASVTLRRASDKAQAFSARNIEPRGIVLATRQRRGLRMVSGEWCLRDFLVDYSVLIE